MDFHLSVWDKILDKEFLTNFKKVGTTPHSNWILYFFKLFLLWFLNMHTNVWRRNRSSIFVMPKNLKENKNNSTFHQFHIFQEEFVKFGICSMETIWCISIIQTLSVKSNFRRKRQCKSLRANQTLKIMYLTPTWVKIMCQVLFHQTKSLKILF